MNRILRACLKRLSESVTCSVEGGYGVGELVSGDDKERKILLLLLVSSFHLLFRVAPCDGDMRVGKGVYFRICPEI
eukprot:122920-Rhodomonas_salina.2